MSTPVNDILYEQAVETSREAFLEIEAIIKEFRGVNRLPYFDVPRLADAAMRMQTATFMMKRLGVRDAYKIDETKD